MTPHRETILLSLAIIAITVGSANAQKKLEWRFEKGQKRESEIVQQITQVVNGEPLGSTATLFISSVVDDVNDDKTAVLTKTVSRVAMSVAMPGGSTIEYDSATAEDGTGSVKMFSDALAPLIGVSVQMTVAKSGKVSDIKQLGTPSKPTKKASTFSPMLQSGQLAQLLAKSYFVLPENEIEEGAKWTTGEKAALPVGKVSLASETLYTFRGTQEENGQQLERFDVQTSVSIKEPAGENSPTDPPTTPAFTISEQRSSGQLMFDSKNSVIVHSKVEQVLTLAFPSTAGEVKSELTFVTSQRTSILEPDVPVDNQTAVVEKVNTDAP